MLGDRAYDSAELRQWLSARGTKPVVPNKSNRKQPFSFDRTSYKQRHRIENAFCRLKDFRRIATRYDRLARNFLASVCLVAAIVWWIYCVLGPSSKFALKDGLFTETSKRPFWACPFNIPPRLRVSSFQLPLRRLPWFRTSLRSSKL